MNLLTLSTLSFAMSMDAFAVAVVKGSMDKNPKFIHAAKNGLFFGIVEAIAPVIGFWLGSAASGYIKEYDHWIAFILLVLLELKFLKEALTNNDKKILDEMDNTSRHFIFLLVTAIATSIDSVIVGVSLAFLSVNIYLAALLIGFFTTVMATLGLYLGNHLGVKFGKWAMLFGAITLIFMGIVILYSHLTDLA